MYKSGAGSRPGSISVSCVQQSEELRLRDKFPAGTLGGPEGTPLAVDEGALLFIALLVQDALRNGIADCPIWSQNNGCPTVIVILGTAILAPHSAPLRHLGHEIKDTWPSGPTRRVERMLSCRQGRRYRPAKPDAPGAPGRTPMYGGWVTSSPSAQAWRRNSSAPAGRPGSPTNLIPAKVSFWTGAAVAAVGTPEQRVFEQARHVLRVEPRRQKASTRPHGSPRGQTAPDRSLAVIRARRNSPSCRSTGGQ